jgi:glycosyltransferase involved in cell wall biosynthesis
MKQTTHISVCICTYKRPELLKQLLSKLEQQETEGLFAHSIVIVDNDASESARQIAESFARQSSLECSYHVEAEQNIARARNKAVENAKGDYVAFIDDDEFPDRTWLLKLCSAQIHHKSDGILGPVLPYFEQEPPDWVLKGRFFERPAHSTGQVLSWRNTRTGNVLLRRELFKNGHQWFDPALGSGGEDRDFFKGKIEEGHVFVWCNEAPVFETIPPARWKRTVLLKRAMIRGKMALNATRSRASSVLKSMVAVVLYTGCLPFVCVLGHHVFMKCLIKDCDHLGKVCAFFGIDWLKEKYVGGYQE